jgi:hypothetical protein
VKITVEEKTLMLDEVIDEKNKLVNEMTENAKLDQDDLLNSLSNDELK